MNYKVLKELSQQVETPAYIFDLDIFNKRAELVKTCFGETVNLCFSIKANPFLVGRLPDIFDKYEVCSPGELSICKKMNVKMDDVIFSGVNKSFEDVERAADYAVGVFTVESKRHFELINNAALRRNKVFPVLIRVTDIKGGSQFGVEEEVFFDFIKNRSQYSGVEIIGVHYFTGTQKRNAKQISFEIEYLSSLIDKAKNENGFIIQRVEYGTGLAIDYFSENADELERIRLEEVTTFIRKLANKTQLTVEMGRFFSANCGYYLTKVIDTKTNYDINYAIVDGGINQLKYDGQIQGMQIPQVIHLKSNENNYKHEKWTLCGSLCTTADVLARNACFYELKTDDILVFTRTGAYSVTEGMALFLSRELPTIAIYSNEMGIRILRKKLFSDKLNS